MGMGKTLSILALLLKTYEKGQKWAQEKRESEFTETRVRSHSAATLVVVPSGRESWIGA
jgi:hypothetical protein